MKEIIPVVIAVLTNKKVIITAVIIFLYLDFCSYIVRYRKKIKPTKTKKIVPASPPPAEKASSESEGGEESSSE